MKFEEMDPRSIEPSPWNTNVVSHENEEKLKAAIERLGMFKPIIVREIEDPSGVRRQCLGGWHRNEQAIELGYATVPVCNVGVIDDVKAKEISLVDNERYGVHDTLKLSGLLEDLDLGDIEAFMPWTTRDIDAMTASIAVEIESLDLDPALPDEDDDAPEDTPAPKVAKTHQLMKYRVPLGDAGKISALIKRTMTEEGFTADDDMTNAGEALAFLLLKGDTSAVS